jgi:hypothetical protein
MPGATDWHGPHGPTGWIMLIAAAHSGAISALMSATLFRVKTLCTIGIIKSNPASRAGGENQQKSKVYDCSAHIRSSYDLLAHGTGTSLGIMVHAQLQVKAH